MRKQKLMRVAAIAAAGMILMTGYVENNSQTTTSAATSAPKTTAASETTAIKVDEAREVDNPSMTEGALIIAKQGMFSSGGTVTDPVEGKYDETQNCLDSTRSGNTAHVDHANVLYQIPANDNGNPIVYLHGYGQSRIGWMTTPDGREGWVDMFLKKGIAHFWWINPDEARQAPRQR